MATLDLLTDFWIKQGDSAEAIQATCAYADGSVIEEDLTNATVEFHMMTYKSVILIPAGVGFVVPKPPTWDEELQGPFKRVGYQWEIDGSTTAVVGFDKQAHAAEFQVTLKPSNRVMTFPNFGYLKVHIWPQIDQVVAP